LAVADGAVHEVQQTLIVAPHQVAEGTGISIERRLYHIGVAQLAEVEPVGLRLADDRSLVLPFCLCPGHVYLLVRGICRSGRSLVVAAKYRCRARATPEGPIWARLGDRPSSTCDVRGGRKRTRGGRRRTAPKPTEWRLRLRTLDLDRAEPQVLEGRRDRVGVPDHHDLRLRGPEVTPHGVRHVLH